jgi:hypothetical protein
MAKRLQFDSSMEIVRSALNARKNIAGPISHDLLLGDVLENSKDRELFQLDVHQRISSQGFTIKRHEIPSEPRFTIGHIAERIVLTALPGDPGTGEKPHKKKRG